jgi:hypothetical protein
MARVHFVVDRRLDLPARAVFDELIDWRGHAEWVPMTRVVIESGDGGVGTTFVATTGIGPLALPDRMRVEELDDEAMTVRIAKVGPVLTGDVVLRVTAQGVGACDLSWDEDVRVPVLPQFLAAPVGAIARLAFTTSIKAMAKRVRRSTAAA